MERALGIVTANYAGKHSSELTAVRPLASLPYGGRYRTIDFAMSNMVNAGIRTLGLIMPHNYRSIIDHVGSGKDYLLDRKHGGLFILPGSSFGTSRVGSRFLLRDLVQNRSILERSDSPYVILSGANFVYNMDLNLIIDEHVASGVDITVLTKRAGEDNGDVMGFEISEAGEVVGLKHGVSYGDTAFLDCFVIGRARLLELLDWYETLDYLDLFEALEHDYDHVRVRTYYFNGYSAAIFNVRDYFRHSMEMLELAKVDELFPEGRPIYTKGHDNPPVKYGTAARVRNSLVSGGCRIDGAVSDSILGRDVVVESGATIRNAIVMQSCCIESGARIENAVIDRNNIIASGTELRGTPEEILVKGKGNR